MFSVDPDVYGQNVDFAVSAARIEAGLRLRLQELAAAVEPPFGPARLKALRAAQRAARAEARRLGALVNRFVAEGRGDHALQGRLQGTGRQLRLLDCAFEALERAMVGRGRPLLEPDQHPGAPARPEDAAFERLFERMHLALAPEVPELTREAVWHGDVPLPMRRFIALMEAASRLLRAMGKDGGWSFLDVGCGVGLKVLAAQDWFSEVVGIELDPARAKAAAQLVRRGAANRARAQDTPTPWVVGTRPRARARIEVADALVWEGYGAFDVIYAYRPIFDADLMTALDRRMVEMARPGALILAPYGDFLSRGGGEGVVALNDFIFLKPAPGLDVAAVTARAADIGTLMPLPPFGGYGDEGMAAPLTAALRRWGHLA